MEFARRMVLLLLTLAVGFAAPVTFGQSSTGQGMGQGMGQGRPMPMYDPSTEMTVKGTVQEVEEGAMGSGHMGQMKGMSHMGTHLIVTTDQGSYTVLVGPSSFLKTKGFGFVKGDQIEVTGSKTKYDGADSLIAREIKKGDKTLTLRDKKGIPEWSIGRRQ